MKYRRIFAERASTQFKTYSLKFLEDGNVVRVLTSEYSGLKLEENMDKRVCPEVTSVDVAKKEEAGI